MSGTAKQIQSTNHLPQIPAAVANAIDCVEAVHVSLGGPASLMSLHSSRTLLRPTSGQVGHDKVCHSAILAALNSSTPMHLLQLRQSTLSPHGRAAARTGSTRSNSHRRRRCKAAASVGSSDVAQVRLPRVGPYRLSVLCAQTSMCLGCNPLTEHTGLQAAVPCSEADCALMAYKAYTGLTRANLPAGREAGVRGEHRRLGRGLCQQPGYHSGVPGCNLQLSHAGPGPGRATSAGQAAFFGRLPEAGAAEQAVPSGQTGSCHQPPAQQPLHRDTSSGMSPQAGTSLSQSGWQQPGADLAGLKQSEKQQHHQQPCPAMDLADAGVGQQPEAHASQQGAWAGADGRRQHQQHYMMAAAPAPPMPRDPGRGHHGWGMFTLGVFLAMALQFLFSWLSVSPFWENIFR